MKTANMLLISLLVTIIKRIVRIIAFTALSKMLLGVPKVERVLLEAVSTRYLVLPSTRNLQFDTFDLVPSLYSVS